MTLTRKTRASGSSIVITIPSQLVEAFDINIGDTVEIAPVKNGEIIIKKMVTDHRYEDEGLNERVLKGPKQIIKEMFFKFFIFAIHKYNIFKNIY